MTKKVFKKLFNFYSNDPLALNYIFNPLSNIVSNLSNEIFENNLEYYNYVSTKNNISNLLTLYKSGLEFNYSYYNDSKVNSVFEISSLFFNNKIEYEYIGIKPKHMSKLDNILLCLESEFSINHKHNLLITDNILSILNLDNKYLNKNCYVIRISRYLCTNFLTYYYNNEVISNDAEISLSNIKEYIIWKSDGDFKYIIDYSLKSNSINSSISKLYNMQNKHMKDTVIKILCKECYNLNFKNIFNTKNNIEIVSDNVYIYNDSYDITTTDNSNITLNIIYDNTRIINNEIKSIINKKYEKVINYYLFVNTFFKDKVIEYFQKREYNYILDYNNLKYFKNSSIVILYENIKLDVCKYLCYKAVNYDKNISNSNIEKNSGLVGYVTGCKLAKYIINIEKATAINNFNNFNIIYYNQEIEKFNNIIKYLKENSSRLLKIETIIDIESNYNNLITSEIYNKSRSSEYICLLPTNLSTNNIKINDKENFVFVPKQCDYRSKYYLYSCCLFNLKNKLFDNLNNNSNSKYNYVISNSFIDGFIYYYNKNTTNTFNNNNINDKDYYDIFKVETFLIIIEKIYNNVIKRKFYTSEKYQNIEKYNLKINKYLGILDNYNFKSEHNAKEKKYNNEYYKYIDKDDFFAGSLAYKHSNNFGDISETKQKIVEKYNNDLTDIKKKQPAIINYNNYDAIQKNWVNRDIIIDQYFHNVPSNDIGFYIPRSK